MSRHGFRHELLEPGALGFYSEVEIRLFDMTLRALAHHFPGVVPAGNFASICGTVMGGKHPDTGQEILLLKGPYGFYVQIGPTPEDKTIKPKRAAWPKNIPATSADLDTALKMLALPRQLGAHPETGKPVEANIGRFGPYVKHDGMFKSIPKAENVHEIALDRAVQLLAENITNAQVTKAFGREAEARAKFDGANQACFDQQRGIFWRLSLFTPAVGFLTLAQRGLMGVAVFARLLELGVERGEPVLQVFTDGRGALFHASPQVLP